MKFTCDAHMAELRLSRANILALLHKLDMPNSARTIYKRIDQRVVVVIAEDDLAHYEGGERGEMHPDTEAFIARGGRDETD
jgi:hypothetical protein